MGDQPRFETKTITGPQNQTVRLIAVPSFRKTGKLVLVDSETLDVQVVKFHVYREHQRRPQVVGTVPDVAEVKVNGKANVEK